MPEKRKLIDHENHQLIVVKLYVSNDRAVADVSKAIAKALDINIGDPPILQQGAPFEEFMFADSGYIVGSKL